MGLLGYLSSYMPSLSRPKSNTGPIPYGKPTPRGYDSPQEKVERFSKEWFSSCYNYYFPSSNLTMTERYEDLCESVSELYWTVSNAFCGKFFQPKNTMLSELQNEKNSYAANNWEYSAEEDKIPRDMECWNQSEWERRKAEDDYAII